MDGYQFESDGQTFPLSTADHARPRVQALAQPQRVQDLLHHQLLLVCKMNLLLILYIFMVVEIGDVLRILRCA